MYRYKDVGFVQFNSVSECLEEINAFVAPRSHVEERERKDLVWPALQDTGISWLKESAADTQGAAVCLSRGRAHPNSAEMCRRLVLHRCSRMFILH